MKSNIKEKTLTGSKQLGQHTSIIFNLLSDGCSVEWYIKGGWISHAHRPISTKIEYDYQQLDDDLEPRPFFKTHSSVMYLDEFNLK